MGLGARALSTQFLASGTKGASKKINKNEIKLVIIYLKSINFFFEIRCKI